MNIKLAVDKYSKYGVPIKNPLLEDTETLCMDDDGFMYIHDTETEENYWWYPSATEISSIGWYPEERSNNG